MRDRERRYSLPEELTVGHTCREGTWQFHAQETNKRGSAPVVGFLLETSTGIALPGSLLGSAIPVDVSSRPRSTPAGVDSCGGVVEFHTELSLAVQGFAA